MKETLKKPRTIGIPRALYYYLYPALWETFFQQIGIVTLVSDATTQRTVELAGRISESEHCLALKIFDAHLAQLADKVEAVFVPRILSTLVGHLSCPKLGALPDAALAGILEKKEVLTIDIDERISPVSTTLLELSRLYGVDEAKGLSAVESALSAMRTARQQMGEDREKGNKPAFLVLGHPYILCDDFFSGQIIRKLKSLGAETELVSFGVSDKIETFFKWDTCSEMYNKMLSLTKDHYAGVIQISSFNCGCDSILMEFTRTCLKEKGIAYMVLVLDEHSSCGWIDTRLEAFVESLRWHYASSCNSNDG